MSGVLGRLATVGLVLAALVSSPSAQERQVLITEGADYFGADYDIRRDVDLESCRAACVGDQQCRAFTFNPASRWCFLKNDLGELRSVAGAISGRIALAGEQIADVEAERITELHFLPQQVVDGARRLAGRIEERPVPSGGVPALVAAAETAASSGNPAVAADNYLSALRLEPNRFELWTAYSRAELDTRSDDWEVQQRLRDDRVSGAVNAYLRAVSLDDRVAALNLVAEALSARDDWKYAIRAWRASLALVENPAIRESYENAVAAHGFRIVEHQVEADAAAPRICLVFSDNLATDRGDLSDFITVEGGGTLAIEAQGQQICVDGVEHGQRYRVSARPGLPSADGEALLRQSDLDIYVRDRAPTARFLGTAYVLPAGGDPTVPIVSVNASRIEAKLYRIGDRQLARTISDGNFLSQLSSWQTDEIADRTGELVWEGSVEVTSELNREVTTAIPVGDMEAALGTGLYVLSAEAQNASDSWAPRATQWFVISDLGLTTLDANDGLHVFVRSLGSAAPLGETKLRLVAVNNEVLGEGATDATGYARFAPGLMRGTGGMAPGLIIAEGPGGDFNFLDLSRAAMDLTDRGVEGREPPQPLDVFLTTERGIYRVGETVYATALVRDAQAFAVPQVPLTAIVTRPDGKEHLREQLADQGQGGNVTGVDIPGNAMRGTWRIAVHSDPEKPALAETSFLVEDFQAERLTFDLVSEVEAIDPAAPGELAIDVRFLYGAPGSDLQVEGDLTLKPVREIAGQEGYVFGLEEESFQPTTQPLSGITTDAEGHATVPLTLPETARMSRPLEATANLRVLDTSGRPVERSMTLPVLASEDRLGIRPLFTELGENSQAAFEVIALGAGGDRLAASELSWTLYKVETNYQWFRTDGRWDYETIRTRNRVEGGTFEVSAEAPTRIEAPVEWGTYEIEVASADGFTLPASYAFEAGWYVEPSATETPEILKLSLDKPRYRIGEAARIHIETRFPGIALIAVMDDRLVTTRPVEVTGESADVEIEVTRDWGPGAYVTAFLYRPMSIEAKRMPARAVGLSWASVDPAERLLQTAISAPSEIEPRRNADVEIAVANVAPGSEAYVTLAAVDLGILNLTRYETPDPDGYYFGQRRLGVAIRDVYNQLIDRMQGVRGVVRSGGDAPLSQFEGPPPPETLVAYHSGVVRLDEAGRARISVPIPDFNGTVRLMAMAWTKDGVGHAEADILVRDPVVIATTLPRFLAPGDRSRLALDLTSVAISGPVSLRVDAEGDAVSVDAAAAGRTLELATGVRQEVLVPVTAEAIGDGAISVELTLPDGRILEKQLPLAVRRNEPPVATTSFVSVAPGASVSVGPEALGNLTAGTAVVDVSASAAGRLNVPAILRALDRYPYGCTEQIASRALPLVYLNSVAIAAGLGSDPELRKRVEDSIVSVLANQAPSGGFGLWGPGSDDLWLDSYVTDFLGRAREAGYPVPNQSFDLAIDNLRNRLAYVPDFETGGQDIAYALYVLAKNGRASIGDLRYYAENKLSAFATPLAKAQIGAALALYGDRPRAATAFEASLADLSRDYDERGWRLDYGSPLRDSAAVLTLAAETRVISDLEPLVRRVEAWRERKQYTSTQEDAWSLLAAHALIQSSDSLRISVNGTPVEGPLVRRFDSTSIDAGPITVANAGTDPVEVAVTISGIPAEPEPAGGSFYEIERAYFTLDGAPADPAAVELGARLVAVLSVRTTEPLGARLIVNDPLPAGFEIDNPHILASGEVAALDWLDPVREPAHVEFRADRFVAALNRSPGEATEFQLAYMVRAISPGTFVHPAAVVEDMYRPERRARTESAHVEVVGPLR